MSNPIPEVLQGISRTTSFLFSFSSLAAILLMPVGYISAQDNSLSGQVNQAMRLNFDPTPDLLGGAQPLPYDRMAAFLTNTLREIFMKLIENEELVSEDGLVGFMSLLNRFWISESVLSFGAATPQEVIGYYLTLVARQLRLFATEKGKSGIAGFMAAAGYPL